VLCRRIIIDCCDGSWPLEATHIHQRRLEQIDFESVIVSFVSGPMRISTDFETTELRHRDSRCHQ
jgi:hypothetical protein